MEKIGNLIIFSFPDKQAVFNDAIKKLLKKPLVCYSTKKLDLKWWLRFENSVKP